MHHVQEPRATDLGRPQDATKTWNSPAAIAEHHAMSPEQRLLKAIALSQTALRFARAERVDER